MMSYVTKPEQGIASVDNPVEDSETLPALDSSPLLPMGWALKLASTKRTRLTDSLQKEYLTEVFQIGERTGYKADPCNVNEKGQKRRWLP